MPTSVCDIVDIKSIFTFNWWIPYWKQWNNVLGEKSNWEVKSGGLWTKKGCNKSFVRVFNKDIKGAEGKTCLCSRLEYRLGHDPRNSGFMLIKIETTSCWDSSGLRKLKSHRRVNEAGWCQSLGKGAPCLVESTCLNVKYSRQKGDYLFPWRQQASTVQLSTD